MVDGAGRDKMEDERSTVRSGERVMNKDEEEK